MTVVYCECSGSGTVSVVRNYAFMFKGWGVGKMYSLVLATSAVIFHFDFYVGPVYYQCMDTLLLCSLVLECSDVC